jgi:hypothetical protein
MRPRHSGPAVASAAACFDFESRVKWVRVPIGRAAALVAAQQRDLTPPAKNRIIDVAVGILCHSTQV